MQRLETKIQNNRIETHHSHSPNICSYLSLLSLTDGNTFDCVAAGAVPRRRHSKGVAGKHVAVIASFASKTKHALLFSGSTLYGRRADDPVVDYSACVRNRHKLPPRSLADSRYRVFSS